MTLFKKLIGSTNAERVTQTSRIDQSKVSFALLNSNYLNHGTTISHVDISSDGSLIASASDDRIVVWDRKSGKVLSNILVNFSPLSHFKITPCVREILVASKRNDGGGRIELIDLKSGQLLKYYDIHDNWIYAIAVSPDGRYAATTGLDWFVKIWEIESGKILIAGKHPDYGSAVAFSEDSNSVLSLSSDWTLKKWNIQNRACSQTYEGDSDNYSTAITHDGKFVAVGNEDKGNSIINVETGKSICSWPSFGKIGAIHASNDSIVVWERNSNIVRAWHNLGKKYIHDLEIHDNVRDLAVSLDGKFMVTGCENGSLGIWTAVL